MVIRQGLTLINGSIPKNLQDNLHLYNYCGPKLELNTVFCFQKQIFCVDEAIYGKLRYWSFLQSTVVASAEVNMSRDKISTKTQIMTMIFAKCQYIVFISSKRMLKCLFYCILRIFYLFIFILRSITFCLCSRLCGKILRPWKKLLDTCNGLV